MNREPTDWILLLLIIILFIFTLTDHFIMRKKMEEIRQENYKERIEYSLNWSRMLSKKQELVIDQLYKKGIIRYGTYTQRALNRENKLWLKQQMQRRKRKASSED